MLTGLPDHGGQSISPLQRSGFQPTTAASAYDLLETFNTRQEPPCSVKRPFKATPVTDESPCSRHLLEPPQVLAEEH